MEHWICLRLLRSEVSFKITRVILCEMYAILLVRHLHYYCATHQHVSVAHMYVPSINFSVYGGSVSSEGLTLGNQSFATSAFLSVADGNRSRCMSDDASFFDQSCANLNMEVVHIFAPPGKLGIALDTPDNSGAPIVHYVKEVSPIHGKILAGDKLIAIDDEDVSYLTAVKISKILNRKSNNITRKLTILRALGVA